MTTFPATALRHNPSQTGLGMSPTARRLDAAPLPEMWNPRCIRGRAAAA